MNLIYTYILLSSMCDVISIYPHYIYGVSESMDVYIPEEGEIVLEEGEILPDILGSNDVDDSVLVIPQLDQCTMCGQVRLSKFRYCHLCMMQYNRKWYNLYKDTNRNIAKIHEWEEAQGFEAASLVSKVGLHQQNGDSAYVAINRICNIVAHQHLLPTHQVWSATVQTHMYAAQLYLQAATNSCDVWVGTAGSNLDIGKQDKIIRISMFETNLYTELELAIQQFCV